MKTQDSFIARIKTSLTPRGPVETSFFAMVFLLILSIGWFFWGLEVTSLSDRLSEGGNPANKRAQNTINYVMGKIHTVISLFSLEGREVKRTYIKVDEPVPQIVKKSSYENKTVTASPKGKLATNAKNTVQKTVTAKKSVGVARIAKAPQQDKRKLLEQRKKEWQEYNSKLDRINEQKKLKDEAKLRNQIQDEMNRAATQNQAVKPNLNTNSPDSADKKKQKPIEEWRREILESSTHANSGKEVIVKFVAAYRAKEVSDIDFYQTIQNLLGAQNDAQKGLGLYALRGTPSYASYMMLVKQQKDFNADFQKYVQDTLIAYNNGSLTVLQQALQSKDQDIIAKTLEIVKVGVLAAKNGKLDSLEENRYRRDQDYVSLKITSYTGFQKILAELSQMTGSTYASLALEIAQLIQATPNQNAQPVVASIGS